MVSVASVVSLVGGVGQVGSLFPLLSGGRIVSAFPGLAVVLLQEDEGRSSPCQPGRRSDPCTCGACRSGRAWSWSPWRRWWSWGRSVRARSVGLLGYFCDTRTTPRPLGVGWEEPDMGETRVDRPGPT